jgi:hypothetical protein
VDRRLMMATPEEVERFLRTYTNSWLRDPDKTDRIFQEGGGVSYPGSQDAIQPDVEISMTDLFHMAAPDTTVRLLNWAERNDVLFTEWELTCTLDGRRLKIHGMNRFHLKGDRALDAAGFVDRLGLLEFFEPGAGSFDLREKLRSLAEKDTND